MYCMCGKKNVMSQIINQTKVHNGQILPSQCTHQTSITVLPIFTHSDVLLIWHHSLFFLLARNISIASCNQVPGGSYGGRLCCFHFWHPSGSAVGELSLACGEGVCVCVEGSSSNWEKQEFWGGALLNDWTCVALAGGLIWQFRTKKAPITIKKSAMYLLFILHPNSLLPDPSVRIGCS